MLAAGDEAGGLKVITRNVEFGLTFKTDKLACCERVGAGKPILGSI
jgi:hypothetical protein